MPGYVKLILILFLVGVSTVLLGMHQQSESQSTQSIGPLQTSPQEPPATLLPQISKLSQVTMSIDPGLTLVQPATPPVEAGCVWNWATMTAAGMCPYQTQVTLQSIAEANLDKAANICIDHREPRDDTNPYKIPCTRIMKHWSDMIVKRDEDRRKSNRFELDFLSSFADRLPN